MPSLYISIGDTYWGYRVSTARLLTPDRLMYGPTSFTLKSKNRKYLKYYNFITIDPIDAALIALSL